MLHKESKILKNVLSEMRNLNEEYESLSKQNKVKSQVIKESIISKSESFSEKKKSREKLFDFIHKK
ncbi:hypothetical protein [Niallia taxi]|uniref:hypothetical protein n=1 Tax=Niallia taxi TaxID=2499688 RepID=UPI0015F4C179|nr:hypothetical protein [Niallia taxi]